MGGDGQVTLGQTIIKHGASKVRKIYKNQVLCGFAGRGADAIALLDRFEGKLESYHGDLRRSAVELVREWRTERIYERLEAFLLVADRDTILLLSGEGEVLEPDHPCIAIGSGGPYAYSAAMALYEHTTLPPRRIVEEALKIASRLCIYTNDQFVVETLP